MFIVKFRTGRSKEPRDFQITWLFRTASPKFENFEKSHKKSMNSVPHTMPSTTNNFSHGLHLWVGVEPPLI